MPTFMITFLYYRVYKYICSPKFNFPTLCLHEAEPGHHSQVPNTHILLFKLLN